MGEGVRNWPTALGKYLRISWLFHYTGEMNTFIGRQRSANRWRLILQLLPLLIVAVVAVVGASQLRVVRDFLASAGGEPANLVVDTQANLGPLPKPWLNLAQGGEMSDWTLAPIQGKVVALQPEYIRIDHIYSFYDVVQRENGQLSFNFTKLDALVDEILAVGAKPYLSLSYMPTTISADGSITGAPANWTDWQETVRATIQHYSGTKKINDVVYEVWNEPDLFGDWKTYGDKNYLTLYGWAAKGAAQTTSTRPFKFGGPATTALYANWFQKLYEYTQANNLRIDFFSWHGYHRDVDQYIEDVAQIRKWQGESPGSENWELHLTEFGLDSENNPGYDNSLGAAHTAATMIELADKVHRVFIFEIEDGKDPQGTASWGRWGLLTHRDFGNQPKPRYNIVRQLNRLQGDQLRVIGNGSWVKALAVKNGVNVEMVVVNYDPRGTHSEEVPLTFQGLTSGKYVLEVTESSGITRKTEFEIDGVELSTSLITLPNRHYYLKLTEL